MRQPTPSILLSLLTFACSPPDVPPEGTPGPSGWHRNLSMVAVVGDIALVQEDATPESRVSIRSLPDLVEVGALRGGGSVRWLDQESGHVIIGSNRARWRGYPTWLHYLDVLPTNEADVGDVARWTFEGGEGLLIFDAIVHDVDADGALDALLFGTDEDQQTHRAQMVPIDTSGHLDGAAMQMWSHPTSSEYLGGFHQLDLDADGSSELMFSRPAEPVALPIASITPPEETTYDPQWTGVSVGDLTADGNEDLLLFATDGVAYLLPAGQWETPLEDLAGGLLHPDLSVGSRHAAHDVTGDGVNDLVVSLYDEPASVRVVEGPVTDWVDLEDLPTVTIPSGYWDEWSFYDMDGDGRKDLLVGVEEEVGAGIHVEVVHGTELWP